ncbi:deoxyguanosinetriphosphate triphosphohydrolase [Novosphingobium sp. FSY-8]|uniref:Deoxyguanosinetriphosphate triphosphohydrolase-like protein n=1 Tax=Novosphingobium ovatum TaxID=1908523 RepID=A0ABW9XB15_9SPHN|nr:deoxyguanosinetriphosphate triphosphohydrolase [Novosphingobium ovatum]NBC35718.1 deoxyguanosinetriphosphate triphosphohydrolase [Novosphingobium ovatum]
MPLSPLACDPAQTRGRQFPMEGALARGPRSCYQRDRDRIVHSIAFRRLRSKTQVFIAPDGDHYRVRMTHSLEVAQIGRVIARQLGLDEDLTEALCLAHDIGHPPFGHAGEDALHAALADHGGWDHNAHCLRVLMLLDSPYCEHDGLNLTWELLEGLAKHNGPVGADTKPLGGRGRAANWALAQLDAAFPLNLREWSGLEAQVAAIADDIAYDNHDIDDGLRAGFLTLDHLMEQPFVAQQWYAVERRHPGAPRERQLRELVRSQIGIMVNDVIAQTRLRTVGMESLADVRAAGQVSATFSPALAEAERELKRFMYQRLYLHDEQLAAAASARQVVAGLFAAFAQDPALMGGQWAARAPDDATARARHIADYIAGMTDRFAIASYQRIHGEVPERLSNV